ncbi:50S ribosomal protein L9 [Euzebyella marina]|uniref:Large ribosomal subunit protein bL9 n=1 Tax=Euzebyella marina TaxID=1761453 RepID=A0A3G2L6H8_9FLAO|nr:50S ribosomal protein L9 [Euzebyella marina]AYN67848.1 50S ribosomal protein L9 [Euzebyella marina]|tara:strand:+ start:304996 stop:305448 length:453 start_codon:yes stop_codon:yes gene_type:complete
MELILKQDVEHLGFKDDIVTVKNGYGRNYLIPRGMATMATPSAKKVLEENLRQRAHKEKKIVDSAKSTADALAKLEVKIPAKVGAGDKLFGSVTSADLADVLAKDGHEIDKKFISIKGGAIKRAGPYTADIRLHREVNIQFDFEVIPEQK